MNRAVLLLGLAVVVATPAAAQWVGEPVWNSPSGGTGVTISGDYAHPNADYGKGNTWGGRASLGLSTITLTAGVASWKPGGATQSLTSVGGNVAFRLIGGSLLPVAINMQLGGARTSASGVAAKATTLIGAAGISVPLPTPGFSIEPYFSPGIRYRNSGGGTNTTNFGYVFGANLGFGLVGVHLAYDHEHEKNGPGGSVFGIGAHLNLHLPVGM
jgi:opacity protein-like surface antigen